MATSIWIPALFALFAWWFSTGAILWIVRRADRAGGLAYRKAVILTGPLFGLGVLLLLSSANDSSAGGVYRGFLAALLIWGWIELSFLTGVLTGPSTDACPADACGFDRFTRAWNVIAYHELALLAGLLLIALISSQGLNPVATHIFSVLFMARILAKFNIFFGVPRINTEFVPAPLQHLRSYFQHAPVTPFFTVSITLLSLTVGCFLHQLWTAQTEAQTIAFTLLTALATLALIEHWFMLLPLPDAKLWRWMLPARPDTSHHTNS